MSSPHPLPLLPAHCFVLFIPLVLHIHLTLSALPLIGLWRVNIEIWYPILCCLQISVKKAQAALSITAQTPDVACISSHCRCNGPECCSLWLHWHPSCAMQHQRKNMRERERCNYPPLSLSLYFPQQQKEISCRNDSYQSKDGRFVSDSRSAAVPLFSSVSAVCVFEVMVVNTNTDIFRLKLRKHIKCSLCFVWIWFSSLCF